jgi:pyruvate dehydrogenase E2 component (dihydrolipoamide acetyltransferase)
MAEVVTMPKLGFDMREGTLVKWLKHEGDNVSKGDVIAEIETDKATVEVEAYASGVMKSLFAKEGDVLPIGEPIAVIGGADENVDVEALKKSAQGAEEATTAQTGGAPTQAAPAVARPAEPGPSAQPAEVAPPQQPVQPVAAAPLTESVTPLRRPEPTGTEPPTTPVPTDGRAGPQEAQSAASEASADEIKASPIARRIASERNVDLKQVTGSGPGGRITRRDIEAFLAQPRPTPAPAAEAAKPPAFGEQRPLSKLRKIIAKRMVEAKQAPHFYVTTEIDMAAAMQLRKDANALLDDAHKLSVNDVIVKAAAVALLEFPRLNASFDGDKIIIHPDINIGIAVALDDGLTTVVVRNADRKTLSQIAGETKTIVARTREGKNRPDDFEGVTFTTSNLGMYDVENFIAIINPPNAAILATGSVKDVPVVVDGELRVGSRMKATISVDHRVSDGAEAARYMQALKRILEQPLRLVV